MADFVRTLCRHLPVLVAAAVAVAATTVAPAARAESERDALAHEARALAADLGAQLRTRLTQAMKEGGPVAAIRVCQDEALPLGQALGRQHGWDVARTSLRVRNPANAPDDFERAVLEDFSRRLAAGEEMASLEDSSLDRRGNTREFRYMKAIGTADACTLCHGKTIAPQVQDALTERYPDDAATGFMPGDIRGAFTLKKVLGNP